jgi:hypothetical protein
VAAKLMWHPSLDENRLAEDFIRGHYGAAAPALEEYQELLVRLKIQHQREMRSPEVGIRYPMNAPFTTQEFITAAKKLFVEARSLARGSFKLTRRVDRAELPVLYVQCVRGPEFTAPDNYAVVIAEFGRTCRNENVRCLREGAVDFESKMAEFKRRIPYEGIRTQ